MSILIRGMEMPTCCSLCPCFNDEYYYCQAADMDLGRIPVESRRPNCPLIEVPPHGRLIDADAINHEDEIWKKKCIPPQVVYNAWVVAGEMPTIIPADKDGESR